VELAGSSRRFIAVDYLDTKHWSHHSAPPESDWSGDVRTLGEEVAEHDQKLKEYTLPLEFGTIGKGKVVGIAASQP
jgi:hypothetical protein